jgi:FkbM family methyltransferase
LARTTASRATRAPTSCSKILLEGAHWHGVLIEPVPHCFERLKANFPDEARFRLEPVAIGKAGKTSFYYVDAAAAAAIPSLPYYHDQLGSFRREHIVQHLGPAIDQYIRERELDVQPLSAILDKHGIGDFQLLHVDVEGYDYEVLKTLDFERHKPTLIFIEHKHLGAADRAEMVATLRNRGYEITDVAGDFFAMDRRRFKADRERG